MQAIQPVTSHYLVIKIYFILPDAEDYYYIVVFVVIAFPTFVLQQQSKNAAQNFLTNLSLQNSRSILQGKDSMVCGKYYSDKFILSESPIPMDAHHRLSALPRCRVPPEAKRPVIWISGCVTYRRISNLKKFYTGGFKSQWQRQSWIKGHSDRALHAGRAEPIEYFNRSITQPLRRESWNCYCAQEKEQQKSVPASGVLY